MTHLNRPVKKGSIGYIYQVNQTRVCYRNSAETGNSLYVNSYMDSQIIQADIYASSTNRLAYITDNMVIKRTIYTY